VSILRCGGGVEFLKIKTPRIFAKIGYWYTICIDRVNEVGMDELVDVETRQDGEKDGSKRYLTAYLLIIVLFCTVAGAYIGWRSSGVIWGIVGAVIGIVFGFFVTGMSWDRIKAKNLPELIEGLGLSLGFLLGLVLIVPSLYFLIDSLGYGDRLSDLLFSWWIFLPVLFVGGIIGAAVGVLVGGILAAVLKRIQRSRI
jgi:uncharacterized membrane protein